MADNGYEGYHITPRFATMIYFDWLVSSPGFLQSYS